MFFMKGRITKLLRTSGPDSVILKFGNKAVETLLLIMRDNSDISLQKLAATTLDKLAYQPTTVVDKLNYFAAAQRYSELQKLALQELHASINARAACIADKSVSLFIFNIAKRELIEAIMFWLDLIRSIASNISRRISIPAQDFMLRYAIVGYEFMAMGSKDKMFLSTKQRFMLLHSKMSDLSPTIKAKSSLFVSRPSDYPALSSMRFKDEIDKIHRAQCLCIAQILLEMDYASMAADEIRNSLKLWPNDSEFLDLQK